MARVCIVDDKDVMRDSLTDILRVQNHEVTAYADPTRASSEITAGRFDVVISDLRMPGMDGIELLRALRGRGLETPFVLMTAYGSVPTAVEAMKLGAFDYIQKPFEAETVGLVVERAIAMGRLQGENEALRVQINDWRGEEPLVGSGRAMRQLRGQIERIAKSQATVLIQGESGVGKERVARAIHAGSPRADRPLMGLNCASLSSTLLETELFGHERGAFSGAESARKGRFELASGGTLLLDEISEVSLPLQGKLLRVLQERQFERVGSSVPLTTDVRVIVTTNRDLSDWVARRRFREDLFFRVSVLPITVPPLRDRREDIPELVEHFIGRIARREGREARKITPRAMALLESYHWPGNVRELQNICERAVVLCQEDQIDSPMIEPWLALEMKVENLNRPLRPGHLMEDMERALIEQTLRRFNGHREKTAKTLGIGVRTLGMKLKRWREEAEAMRRHQEEQRAVAAVAPAAVADDASQRLAG